MEFWGAFLVNAHSAASAVAAAMQGAVATHLNEVNIAGGVKVVEKAVQSAASVVAAAMQGALATHLNEENIAGAVKAVEKAAQSAASVVYVATQGAVATHEENIARAGKAVEKAVQSAASVVAAATQGVVATVFDEENVAGEAIAVEKRAQSAASLAAKVVQGQNFTEVAKAVESVVVNVAPAAAAITPVLAALPVVWVLSAPLSAVTTTAVTVCWIRKAVKKMKEISG